jgi:hypothetical protein
LVTIWLNALNQKAHPNLHSRNHKIYKSTHHLLSSYSFYGKKTFQHDFKKREAMYGIINKIPLKEELDVC